MFPRSRMSSETRLRLPPVPALGFPPAVAAPAASGLHPATFAQQSRAGAPPTAPASDSRHSRKPAAAPRLRWSLASAAASRETDSLQTDCATVDTPSQRRVLGARPDNSLPPAAAAVSFLPVPAGERRQVSSV